MSLTTLNPDIILEIMRKLKDNSSSLFRLLLANRHFSELVVPVLWENPFGHYDVHDSDRQYFLVIQSYINSFNEEERNKINEILKKEQRYVREEADIYKKYFNKEFENNERKYFQYGKYLKEFNIPYIMKAIDTWFKITKITEETTYQYWIVERNDLNKCLMNSIMRQCQRLDFLNWDMNIMCNDFIDLLEIMQYKIKDLKSLTLTHCRKIKDKKNIFEYFKNHCKTISSLTINNIIDDTVVKEIISFIESQKDLNEFIFNHVKEKCNVKDLITSTLELRANNLTKLILNKVDFSDISFNYIAKCINLEILGLRSSKGLTYDDDIASFKNLKVLDSSYNEWSSEVTSFIIERAGKTLSSLTIGENDAIINDNTLIVITKSCPNISSLSISRISNKNVKMVLSYLKDLKLVTLQLYQIGTKNIIMKSKVLRNYIKNEGSLSTLGLGENDKYWNSFNEERKEFDKFMSEHKARVIAYKPKVRLMG